MDKGEENERIRIKNMDVTRTRNRQRSQSMMEETFQSRFSAEDRDISTSWTHLTDGSWYPS